MTTAFVFPGQGSQTVGMGKALADAYPQARAVFEEVDDALGAHLSRLIFTGPEDALRLTENAQPALMAVSMAVVRVLEAGGITVAGHAAYVAGHSLGESSALAAAGSFSVADAARLLRLRGQAMQRAVPVGEGAMAALLGLDLETVSKVAREAAEGEVCATANDNAPGQIVISGHVGAINRAIEIAKRHGCRRALLLPVSAPFHCSLMASAAEAMAEAVATLAIADPLVALIANVTARPTTDADEIRQLLVDQVTGVVRWRESVEHMVDLGVTRMVELGAGKVLTGLGKRINPEVRAISVGTPEDIDEFAKIV